MYWALTSILGGQYFLGRAEEIDEEWRLNTPELVQARAPGIYKLLTNSQYGFPTRLPDEKYQGDPMQFRKDNP